MADVKITPERQRVIDHWALEDLNEQLRLANAALAEANTRLTEENESLRASVAAWANRLPSTQGLDRLEEAPAATNGDV